MLAGFVKLPEKVSQGIDDLKDPLPVLIPKVTAYENRYFPWKISETERKLANDLAKMKTNLAALERNQKQLQNQGQQILQSVSSTRCEANTILVAPSFHPPRPAQSSRRVKRLPK